MNQVLSELLTYLALYGYPIVAAIIAVGYTGVPVPSEAILLAGGALTDDGSLNFYFLGTMVTAVALAGDILAYCVGKKYGLIIIKKFGRLIRFDISKTQKTDHFLQKWGVGAIFITRWLITPLGIPLSLLSGITEYPFKRFLLAAFSGDLIWAFGYIYLGAVLGANWVSIYYILNNFFYFILLFLLGGIFLYLGTKMYHNRLH